MPKRLPYDVASLQIISLYERWEREGFSEEYAEFLTIPIKEILFCTPMVPSGLASKDAADTPLSKVTRDHYYSRTRTARRILEYMRQGILSEKKLPRFEAFLKSRSRVHYITFPENRRLSTRDRVVDHWRFQYSRHGIDLVPYRYKRQYKRKKC